MLSDEEYREKLRGILQDPSNGIVLHADDFVTSTPGSPEPASRAAFELISGHYHRRYLTLWKFIELHEEFQECIKYLSRKARAIRSRHPYTAIVTCTQIAKHLLDQVHADIEHLDERVDVHYLGQYPFHARMEPIDFSNERVLILADVIDSGTLVVRLSKVVERWGGTTAAILCVARLDGGGSANGDLTPLPDLPGVSVESLTDLSFRGLQKDDFDADKVRKIDPLTLLPVENPSARKRPEPLFATEEMYRHFEESDAIDFDFFRVGSRQFTTAVRIPRLLKDKGETIWEKIRGLIPQGVTVVTTFDRADMPFREFIEGRLLEERRRVKLVHVPNRDSPENPYFLLPGSDKALKDADVILILASLHTAEKLRTLAALLASHSVARIDVICLINRMEPNTIDFVSRIERLLRGLSRPGSRPILAPVLDWMSRRTGLARVRQMSHAIFSFYPIYNVPEISSEQVFRMQQIIDAIFSRYLLRTRVTSFRNWIEQERKYFESQPVTASSFVHASPKSVSREIRIGGKVVGVRTQEAWLSMLCHQAIAARNYKPLIEEIGKVSDKHTLYKLFAILISDVNFLRLYGTFSELRAVLMDRIIRLRSDRLAVERNEKRRRDEDEGVRLPFDPEIDQSIHGSVQTETHLLVGLSLFSFHDPEFDYRTFLSDTLTCGLEMPDDWQKYPINFVRYYGNDRVAWAISMLLLLSQQRLRDRGGDRDFKKQLVDMLRQYTSFAQRFSDDNSVSDDEFQRGVFQAKINLYFLLAETGAHDARRRHEIIRYLHSQLLTPKRRHNPINNSLEAVKNSLEAVIQKAANEGLLPPDDARTSTRRISFPQGKQRRDIQSKLEDAIYTIGILQEVAEVAGRMFLFTPANGQQIARFTSRGDHEGFAADILRLGRILAAARRLNSISLRDFQLVTQLKNVIFTDLWYEKSPLVVALTRYSTPLSNVLVPAMMAANDDLAREGYVGVWAGEIERFTDTDKTHHVLAERQKLQEILRNICFNVRHVFKDYALPPGLSYADLVNVEIQVATEEAPLPESGAIEYVYLRVKSTGRPVPEVSLDGATLGQQAHELSEYGGSIDITRLEEGGSVVELKLITRRNLFGGLSDSTSLEVTP